MTKRRKKLKVKSRTAPRTGAARKVKGDPQDAFIGSAAKLLGLTLEKSWLPSIRTNLDVTLRHAARVVQFPLPDEAEPAPVFKA